LFVPINRWFCEIDAFRNTYGSAVSAVNLVDFHTVNRPIFLKQVQGRKYQVLNEYQPQIGLKGFQRWLLDGSRNDGKLYVVNNLDQNINSIKVFDVCTVLQYIECSNGVIYLIDKPLLYNVL
jgi:uncharacterized surface protein with fasciclin (FAS1) repeats